MLSRRFLTRSVRQFFERCLENVESIEDIALARRFNAHIRETFKGINDRRLFDAIERERARRAS